MLVLGLKKQSITCARSYLSFRFGPAFTYLHVRYGHKTQASLLSLEFISKQLEAGLSPVELNCYGIHERDADSVSTFNTLLKTHVFRSYD
jgi:hypothetical protein